MWNATYYNIVYHSSYEQNSALWLFIAIKLTKRENKILGQSGAGYSCFSLLQKLSFWVCFTFPVKFLKFVEKTAPVAVYTSGKGSSAAGLTASVIRDNSSVCSCTFLGCSFHIFYYLIVCFGGNCSLVWTSSKLLYIPFSVNFIWKEGPWFWQMGESSALMNSTKWGQKTGMQTDKSSRLLFTVLSFLLFCKCHAELLFMKPWNNKPFPLLKLE